MNAEREAFEAWWNSDKPETTDNPFRPDSAAYWAWSGWQAATLAERERCDAIVTAYRVPVGNSPAGEIACDMTMSALREIRDEIRKGEKP